MEDGQKRIVNRAKGPSVYDEQRESVRSPEFAGIGSVHVLVQCSGRRPGFGQEQGS